MGSRSDSDGTGASDPDQGEGSRILPAGARFSDLVAAIRRLDERGDGESDEGCLLDPPSTGPAIPLRLRADLAPAMHPIPEPPTDLARRVGAAGAPVRVFTRWGTRGSGDLALSALTTTPPDAGAALAVILTEAGVYMRRSDGGVSDEQAGPFASSQLAQRVALATEGVTTMLVTADAEVTVDHVARALAELPATGPAVGLAVALRPDVRVPDETPPPTSYEALCANAALPSPPADIAEGSLPQERIVAGLQSLRPAVAGCFQYARGEAARGGRLRVLFRIDPTGHVGDACAVDDALGDASLRRCVVSAVRSLRFDPPRPVGFVDVSLPLDLVPRDEFRQAPLCH